MVIMKGEGQRRLRKIRIIHETLDFGPLIPYGEHPFKPFIVSRVCASCGAEADYWLLPVDNYGNTLMVGRLSESKAPKSSVIVCRKCLLTTVEKLGFKNIVKDK
jgi:hypothetical protein